MECQIVNLEAGMPAVEQARTHLNMALRGAKANRVRALKLIHGYGSSGKGGAIRADVRAQLAQKKRVGQIREFVPGEDFSPFDSRARTIVAACPSLARDTDYSRTNHGVTVVLL
ncbi:MAG: Smr/MutS family protein [Oscillospiraceae bacterium]|nr:Smr/MutS family protein [Oscillospiraceae bacterium]